MPFLSFQVKITTCDLSSFCFGYHRDHSSQGPFLMGKDVTHLAHWWYLACDASHGTLFLSKYRACAKPHHVQPEGLGVTYTWNQSILGQLSQPKREGWTHHLQAQLQLHLHDQSAWLSVEWI